MPTEITHVIVHDFHLVSRYINKSKKENLFVIILLLSFFRWCRSTVRVSNSYLFCFACRFTPAPDSVIKSAMLSGESVNVLDSRQQVRHAKKTRVEHFQPLNNFTVSNSSKLSMANV